MPSRRVALLLIPVAVCALIWPARAMAQAAQAQPPAAALSAGRPAERVAIINMQGAVAGCNEGQRDLEAFRKKFEPRRAELDRLSAELDGLKKQLATQGAAMAPAGRDALTKSIDTKTKTIQRLAEDFRNETEQQQNEIAGRILQKLAPVLKKYAEDHGFALVLDGSVPWPQGPVVMVAPAIEITKAVIDAYNTVSGVPAPPKSAK